MMISYNDLKKKGSKASSGAGGGVPYDPTVCAPSPNNLIGKVK